MTPGLVESIRQRLDTQTTAELQRIWAENDTVTYSAETFEAIRQILTARGDELPPPRSIPMTRAVGDQTHVDFWVRLLRPICWIGIGLGTLSTAVGIGVMARTLLHRATTNVPPGLARAPLLTPGMLWTVAYTIGLPLLLVFSAASALTLRPPARTFMLIYSWAEIGLTAYYLASTIYWRVYAGTWTYILYDIELLERYAYWAVYPLLVLLFMTRPQVRALFTRPARGFPLDAEAGDNPPSACA
jgi:hypothetical protein